MKTMRDVAWTVAAVGVLLTLTLGAGLPNLLFAERATSSETDEPSPQADQQEVPPSGVDPSDLAVQTGRLDVAPAQIAIVGRKPCPGNLCKGDVAYSPARLTVRIVQTPTMPLTATTAAAPTASSGSQVSIPSLAPPYQLFHPPLHGRDGLAYLNISRAQACESQVVTSFDGDPRHSMGLRCYEIGVGGDLPAGVYTSTLKVSAGQGTETSADVRVTVGLAKWWPLLTVMVGVLVTEFLSLWGARWKYAVGWNNLRARWLDLLSERLEWAELFEGGGGSQAVRHVKAELRLELDKLSQWLDLGRRGEVTLAAMPANLDAAREKVYPLRRTVERYLDTPTVAAFDRAGLPHVPAQLKRLADAAAEEAVDRLRAATRTAEVNLHDPLQGFNEGKEYKALAAAWTSAPSPPTDQTLLVAWHAIREIVEDESLALAATFAPVKLKVSGLGPNTPIATRVSAGAELTGYLKLFRAAVVDAAKDQQTAVESVAASEPGQKETAAVLEALIELEGWVTKAEREVTSADQPLRYYVPDGAVSIAMERLEETLAALDDQMTLLTFPSLSEQALHEILLKPVRQGLQGAHSDMSQPQTDLRAVWDKLNLIFAENRLLIRVGRRLLKLKRDWQDDDCWSQIERHVTSGSHHLLAGDVLGAQIELERAESRIQTCWPNRFRRWLRPQQLPEWLAPAASPLSTDTSADKVDSSQTMLLILTALRASVLVAALVVVALLVWYLSLAGGTGPTRPTLRFPNWWKWLLGGLVVLFLLDQIRRLLRQLRLDILLRESLENVWPAVVQSLLGASSQVLTVAVAVVLVIVYNRLANTADTWGSFFDFATAFTWGVLANRTAKPLQSGWEKLLDALKPQKAEPENESSASGS